jgi:hypothetical protein
MVRNVIAAAALISILCSVSTSAQTAPEEPGPVRRADRPEPSEIEQAIHELVSRGEYEEARALERRMYRYAIPDPNSSGPAGFPAPSMGLPGEEGVQDPGIRWGNDVLVHSGGIRAHDCDYTAEGEIWTAVSLDPESTVYVYSSDDGGESWTFEFWSSYDEPIFELEILSATGDSNFVFLFAIIPYIDGRLHMVRYDPETFEFEWAWVDDQDLPVSDVSACKDYYDGYYLYVLYTDESGPSVNGKFKRSRDFGLSWNADPADTIGWNLAWDPHISCGGGAWLHTICKLSNEADILFYFRNELFGHSNYWWGGLYPNADSFQVWDPCIIATPSVPDSEATVWTLYTHAWQGTNDLDVDYAYSQDGGTTWNTGNHLAWSTRMEFGSDCGHYFPAENVYAGACYHNATSSYDTIDIYSTHVSGNDPEVWSTAAKANEERACVLATAQLTYAPPNPPENGPGVLFTRYGPEDLYMNAPWFESVEEAESPLSRPASLSCRPAMFRGTTDLFFEVERRERVTISVYDPTGRKVRSLLDERLDPGRHRVAFRGTDDRGIPLPGGVYLIRLTSGNRTQTRRTVLLP